MSLSWVMYSLVIMGTSASNAHEPGTGQAAGFASERDETPAFLSSGGVRDVGATGSAPGPDVTFCELYGLQQFGRVGSIVGLAITTTSWNIGNADLQWFQAPNPAHPFIVTNLYRLKNDRCEQIGQSWIKHGFFALSDEQCGTDCTYEPGHTGGNYLGMGCTDTYSAGLNASQSFLGPREEVNPWTGVWDNVGYHHQFSHSHNAIDHRLQVHDDDLNSSLNPGATYIAEGYYVHLDDVNVMNSAAWKTLTVFGSPGGTWTFSMPPFGIDMNTGFAIDAWTGATQTLLAEEVPPIEGVSPDGRSLLAAKVTDLGNGQWHYEYALLNIDMHRKGCWFSIPVGETTTLSNIAFHAVKSHGESYNNTPWTVEVATSGCPDQGRCIRWSTSPVDNPLRWGTLYNFRFDADVPPATGSVAAQDQPAGSVVTLGLCEPDAVTSVSGMTVGPSTTFLVVPPAPIADGIGKNRYLSVMIPLSGAGKQTALRVRFDSLYHPSPSPPFGEPPDFSSFEGQVRYVALLDDGDCPDSTALGLSFRCATLSCAPEYRDWAGEQDSAMLHVTATAIVPSSQYTIVQLADSCAGQEETCTDISTGTPLVTADWGDVDGNLMRDVLDVSALVDKVKDLASGTLIKPRTQLQPNQPDPLAPVNVLDVANGTDSLKGFAYPYPGPQACP